MYSTLQLMMQDRDTQQNTQQPTQSCEVGFHDIVQAAPFLITCWKGIIVRLKDSDWKNNKFCSHKHQNDQRTDVGKPTWS